MRVLRSRGIVAIAKPRCGSTSVRRMLDPFIDVAAGDLAVDVAGEQPPFHPHISAPYLREILAARFDDADRLEYFITVRHPHDMLWSYYQFFRPDSQCRYNFQAGWSASDPIDFETWVCEGHLDANPNLLRLGPDWISPTDLSPLTLEARARRRDGSLAVDHIFPIEEMGQFTAWRSNKLGEDVSPKHVNQSNAADRPRLGEAAQTRIRQVFAEESEIYGL